MSASVDGGMIRGSRVSRPGSWEGSVKGAQLSVSQMSGSRLKGPRLRGTHLSGAQLIQPFQNLISSYLLIKSHMNVFACTN